jgi:hypothetical protein
MLVSFGCPITGKDGQATGPKIVSFSSSLNIFYAILRQSSAYCAIRYNLCSVTQELIRTVGTFVE